MAAGLDEALPEIGTGIVERIEDLLQSGHLRELETRAGSGGSTCLPTVALA